MVKYMCGGISFKISQIPKSELVRVYGKEKAGLLREKGYIESKYWDQRPVLPIAEGEQVKLFDWGNRDKSINLPRTGWAMQESLEVGKWDYLNPQQVNIIADWGYEKGVWFEIEGEIAGIKVEKNGIERVYMETKPASSEYKKMTGHDREPVIVTKK